MGPIMNQNFCADDVLKPIPEPAYRANQPWRTRRATRPLARWKTTLPKQGVDDRFGRPDFRSTLRWGPFTARKRLILCAKSLRLAAQSFLRIRE